MLSVYATFLIKTQQCILPLSVLSETCGCAGGQGVPALSVEGDPGWCGCCLLRWSPPAAALLASRVGRQGDMYTHVSEGCTHPAAQN